VTVTPATTWDASDFPPALIVGVEYAVSLRIQRLKHSTFQQRAWRAREAANQIAAHGDALIHGSKVSGRPAKVFNHLAEGLAVLAYQPGGVRFAGLHFQAQPSAGSAIPRVDFAAADRRLAAIRADLAELGEADGR
jgi:hypothetical protein